MHVQLYTINNIFLSFRPFAILLCNNFSTVTGLNEKRLLSNEHVFDLKCIKKVGEKKMHMCDGWLILFLCIPVAVMT